MEGPAEAKGGKLIITKIPSRAKFSLKIIVIAWQYGWNIEPKIQTADSLLCNYSIYIERKRMFSLTDLCLYYFFYNLPTFISLMGWIMKSRLFIQ